MDVNLVRRYVDRAAKRAWSDANECDTPEGVAAAVVRARALEEAARSVNYLMAMAALNERRLKMRGGHE